MVGLTLCAFALVGCYLAGRRSLAGGLTALLTVGYLYGIVRGNIPSMSTYFFFDAGAVGLYAAQLLRPLPPAERVRVRPILTWMGLLIGWPTLLLLAPIQDPLIQLVGLRAHVFFLPFLYLGARLRREDVSRLALSLALLNLVAFGFAAAEFLLGVDRFFPRNAITDIIYRSTDVRTAGALLRGAFRIPSTFAHSGLYAGAMVVTLPLLLGRWLQRRDASPGARLLLTAGLAASVLGVFLAASRQHFMVLVILVTVATVSGRLGVAGQVAWMMTLAGVAWVVSTQERLFQRLMSLSWDTILERISWGVNASFVSFMFEYPLGNGLGGGGNPLPYFLQPLVRNPVAMENQYAVIMLEQGVPGLLLWVAFIGWVLTRRTTARQDPWYLARLLTLAAAGAYFLTGLIGVGLFTAVPFTVVLLLGVGWVSVPQSDAAARGAAASVGGDVVGSGLPRASGAPGLAQLHA